MASSKNYTDLDSMVGSNGGSTGGRKKAPSKKGGQPTERARRIVKKLWIAAGCVVAAVMLFFIAAYNGWIGYMPPVEELKNPQDKFASVVLTSDGVEMGRFFKDQSNRVYADYSEISQNVIDALVATEDVRFESHSGIDLKALTRAVTKTLILGKKSAGGGSTITQQLAKLLYTPQSDGFYARMVQKPIEWMIAIKLERYYSKEEIIKMYLNQFDFLYNAVGIKSAAQVYFNKEAKDLSLLESALLVGMVKNPAYFNPVRHPERAIKRRNVVLEQMVKAGMLDEDEYSRLCNEPLGLDFHRISHNDGIAPYFREELRRYLTAKKPDKNDYPTWDKESFVSDSILWVNNPLYGWVQKNPKADGSYYNIYNDGLRIHTTIDSRMQAYAEEAVNEHMSDLQRRFFKEKAKSSRGPYTTNRDELSDDVYNRLVKNSINQSERARVARIAGKTEQELMAEFNTPYDMTLFSYSGPVDTTMTPLDSIRYVKSLLRTGFMAMDPRNGQVKAYVGGPDFRFMQYDMVSKGRRQVGSTIKPYLYTLAMEDGKTPCDQYLNTQPTFHLDTGKDWSPRNAGSARIGEMVDLRWALTNSNNWISARLISDIGPERLVKFMHSLGITAKIDPVLALALGPCEISLKEMVAAYSTFANKGMRVDPIYVTAITDNAGNVIEEFKPNQTEVISEKAYYRILSILLNVVDSGTGNRLRRAPYNLVAQMGGKTGTTNSNSDGWFMGFTPELVAGTWVGGDERYIHFNTMANGQGAEMALPIYGKFMRKVYNDKTLPYDQSSRFVFPDYIDLCEGGGAVNEEVAESTMADAFD